VIHENVEFDFYFIRHGESQSNVTPGIAAGVNFNAPMTERGHKQAEALGRRLADEGVQFERIYSSTLTRAVQTTESMLRGMGIPDAEFEKVGAIIERQVPAWRGKLAVDVMPPEVRMLQAEKGKWFKPADGETDRWVERRASNWLEDEITYNPNWLKIPGTHTIAIVSHGDTLRNLFHYITGMDNRLLRRTDIFNCSISRFRFGQNGWYIGTINDSLHTRSLGDVVRDDKIVQGSTP
ncbi:MAG: histidine phosphatase family protein, partial [Dehalococcoidia bacterium]|nr:histidine phosphatase family protein [Dehalococcoidia bacterium]